MNRNKIRFQLSLTEFVYNGCFSASNFLSVFLTAIGVSAGQMGLITALLNGVGIVSQPTWGVLSDRVRSVRRCFMLCMAGTALCAMLIPPLSLGEGLLRAAMVAVLMALNFFFHPSNMMMELWLVHVNDHPRLRIPYGSVRSWASIGYALFSLLFVPVLRSLHVRFVYVFFAVFALLSLLLASRIPPESEGESAARQRVRLRDMPFGSILGYWIVGHIVFEILYQIPFGWRVTYMVYALPEFGADSSLYGALLFVSGICEVPMLLLIRRLTQRIGWAWPLLLSVALLCVEYSLYAFGRAVPTLFAAQLLRGFSFALYVSSRYQYLHRLSPEGLEASTQALVSAVSAVAGLLAAAAGGFLLEALGTRPFFALLSLLQLVPGVFLMLLHLFGARRPPLPDPECRLFGRPKA